MGPPAAGGGGATEGDAGGASSAQTAMMLTKIAKLKSDTIPALSRRFDQKLGDQLIQVKGLYDKKLKALSKEIESLK